MPASTGYADAVSGPQARIIGYPAKHSRSPLIHGFWLRRYGLPGNYGIAEIAPPDLPAFIASLRHNGLVGGNVTVPHKEAAFRLVDEATDTARALEAVNTLWFEDGKLWGDNTDVRGFLANLDAGAPGWRAQASVATVLGAGGAARAIVHGLLEQGVERVVVVNRTPERAVALADHFERASGSGRVLGTAWSDLSKHLPASGLLVNTTSLGMQGQPPLTIDLAPLRDTAVVTDIVYVPLVTPLLASAAARGLRTVGGLGMLLHQAVPGFTRWFGRTPEVTPALQELVEADILGKDSAGHTDDRLGEGAQ